LSALFAITPGWCAVNQGGKRTEGERRVANAFHAAGWSARHGCGVRPYASGCAHRASGYAVGCHGGLGI